jgi:hypothetical protein
MSELKPIETIHSGWRFRSRLEAKWGIFFETLGIDYIYEKEGFDLDGLWYLPDFFFPQYDCWIEIKPVTPTPEEREKVIRLALASHKHVAMFVGDVWHDVQGWAYAEIGEMTRENVNEIFQGESIWTHWLSTDECICPSADGMLAGFDFKRGIRWFATTLYECQQCHAIELILGKSICTCNPRGNHLRANSPRIIEAFTAARQARFGKGGRG